MQSARKIGTYVQRAGEPFALLAELKKDAALSQNASAKLAFDELNAMCEFMKVSHSLRSTTDFGRSVGTHWIALTLVFAVV